MSRRARNGGSGEEGQALLEFVISFPLVVFLVLAVLEFAHYANAVQLAQYAAFCAARAQIVHGRDETAAAKAAALAMAPFAEGNLAPYQTVTADGTAASAAASVSGTLSGLTGKNKAYESGKLSFQDARVRNSFHWQTCTWMWYCDKNDKPATSDSYAYVKAGVCFTYPLRVQSLAVLSARIVRAKDRKADDDKAASLFGGAATNAMTPPNATDWWARAEKISQASGLVVVPVVQGCILGR